MMFWALLLLPLLAAEQSGEEPDHQSDCNQRHQPPPVQHCLLQGQQRQLLFLLTMITLVYEVVCTGRRCCRGRERSEAVVLGCVDRVGAIVSHGTFNKICAAIYSCSAIF